MVLGKRREGSEHRAEKAAGFLSLAEPRNGELYLRGMGQETQSQQDHQSYQHSIQSLAPGEQGLL